MRNLGVAAFLVASAMSSATAFAQSPAAFFNCRASAVHGSILGNDRIEPVVANGNPNTGEGKSPDFALCANADVGAGSLATQAGIPPTVLSAATASAITTITPAIAQAVDQVATSSARVEDLKLPLGGQTVVLGAAVATSQAEARCVNGLPVLSGNSQLTGLTLGGTPVTLDELISTIATALAPLSPIIDIKVNEQVRDATSLTVRALHVKILTAAGASPLLDLVVSESKVTGPSGVCVRRTSSGDGGTNTGGATSSNIRPCPPGSELDAPSGRCVIRDKGPNGSDIIIGLPYQGPSGGTVVAITDARSDPRLRNSPCVKAPGSPRYVVVGTQKRDRITGTNQRDRIVLLGGNDSAAGGRGADCLDGGNGRDALSGGIGSDRIYGQRGNDALNGASDNDLLSGGSGNDSINAGFGADRVTGGSGNDAINVATSGRKARVNCGTGRDKVRFNQEERRVIGRSCEIRYGLPDGKRGRRR